MTIKENKIVLNSDYKIVEGKRKFVPMSIDELKDKFRSGFLRVTENNKEYTEYFMSLFDDFGSCPPVNFLVDSNDFKYVLCECDDPVYYKFSDNEPINSLQGLHTLSNGFTFFGCYWMDELHNSMFAIVYFDKGKFKCYIPTKGNTVNRDFKRPIGSESEEIFDDYKKSQKIAKNYLKEDRLFGITKQHHEQIFGLIIDESTKISAIPDDLDDVCWQLSYLYKYFKDSNLIDWNDPTKLAKIVNGHEDIADYLTEEDFKAMEEEILLHFTATV